MATEQPIPPGKYDETTLGESQVMPMIRSNRASENGVQIEVCNPQVKDETFNKFVVYTIKGSDNNGEFEVVRRYSDFTKLRNLLVTKWPGCYIPPLPPKALNSLEPKVVRERRRYLQQFCNKIAEINYLHYYQGYQEFIRTKGSSLDKILQPFMKTDYEEIINRYATIFSQLSGREYNLSIVKKITEFKLFLKKVQAQVLKMKKLAKKMSKAKQNYYQEFAFMNGLVLMEYEKTVFSQYHQENEDQNVFYDARSAELYKYAEKVEEGAKKASLEYLEEWMRSEAREIEAFLDALHQKDVYDNLMNKIQGKQKSESAELQKVLAGKTTVTTVRAVIFRKNKVDEIGNLEKQIEKHGKEYEDLIKLNDMITLILAYEEIDKFRLNKEKSYHNRIKAAADNELRTLTNLEQYWDTILSNKNISAIENNS